MRTKDGHAPFMAVWTTDFDCNENTGWYHVIREAPFSLQELDRHYRKEARRALRLCSVRRIRASDYAEEIYNVHSEAYMHYENWPGNTGTLEGFKRWCITQDNKDNIHYWAGFNSDGLLIGYMVISVHDEYIGISTASFWPKYMNLRVSDALYSTVLDYYLNQIGKRYVDCGTRNISHITNTQSYKEQHFKFRKAYCRLHMLYNPKIRPFIRVLRLFRPVLKLLDRIHIIHEVNAVLLMEDIAKGRVI